MTKPLTELFESKVAYARETLLKSEKTAYRKNARDYAEACFQFGGDQELRDPWFHGVGFDCGSEKEAERRKPIDLATKKLIETLEFIRDHCRDRHVPAELVYLKCLSESSTALAEFRAILEDGE